MYEQEIARGVAVLNKRVPDWRARINVDELNLANVTCCVIGQVLSVRSIAPGFGDSTANWAGAVAALSGIPAGPRGYTSHAQRDWTIEHGFDTALGVTDRYATLTAAWKDYLRSEALV